VTAPLVGSRVAMCMKAGVACGLAPVGEQAAACPRKRVSMALGDLIMTVSESGTALGQVLDSGQRCPARGGGVRVAQLRRATVSVMCRAGQNSRELRNDDLPIGCSTVSGLRQRRRPR
jgi:hypothetical protein